MSQAVGGASAARHAAETILSERRFHPTSLPRPLHGPLAAIGRALASAGRAVVDAVAALGHSVPGGAATVWGLLGLGLFLLVQRWARRRSRRLLRDHPAGPDSGSRAQASPEALERDALAAEREGRLGDAVRLRFRAGLARLAARGAIGPERSLSTAAVARELGSPRFDALSSRFEEIAYGGAAAEPRDVETAREGWPRVLSEADPR